METIDPDELTPEEVERRQLQLVAAEDQWNAAWGPGPKPKKVPDLRPLVHHLDAILQSAAHILGAGVALSPRSVQQLKNALWSYESGQAYERGEMTAEELDAFTKWLYGPEAEGLKAHDTDQNR
jgi:hypothetical protein